MAFTINTNIASLSAQEALRINGDFQNRTIGRVTTGLRITQSGDDAAGLAIANSYRSDQAVLTQGIRNANDGLSQLQIIDGGLNNISKLLDRARTLATQSASGTFNGSRTKLNDEFQNVVAEIGRQAQAIGLNSGGGFAQNLRVFVGGGAGATEASKTTNGTVSLDLSSSTVDSKSLGLKGVQAIGVAATDIGTGSATTSVQTILANTTNTGSQTDASFTEFYFRGPGFGGNDRVKVRVNTALVTTADNLVTTINAAIETAGNGGTAAATAFKNAGVKASVYTDSSGRKQLAFSSSNTAFQVSAGDRTANALLGNFSSGSTGRDLTQQVSGAAAASSAVTTFTNNSNVIVRFQGASLNAAVDIRLAITGGTTTVANAIADLSSQVTANSALQAAGITPDSATFSGGNTLSFTSKRGEKFEAQVAGDVENLLGFGTYRLQTLTSTSFDHTSVTNSGTTTAGAQTLEFSIAGGTSFSISATATTAAATSADALNLAFQASSSARDAGLYASVSGSNVVIQSSISGTAFRINAQGANDRFGFGAAGTATLGAASSSLDSNSDTFNAGGSTDSGLLAFGAIRYGDDDQAITISAVDASGVNHTKALTLRNDGTDRNARSIDEAIAEINAALQESNDTTLQRIFAVKENDAGTEKIRFLSGLSNFKVSVGNNATGAAGVTTSQGSVVSGSVSNGGSTSDISTRDNAQTAVSALATAVSLLGDSQAAVGKGQNNFSFAVNLASSQLTNTAAAESRIRDADLAQEAANLTKAQIVLQAGIAALAQANSAPQAVLALLRG